jgi:hypothetical protein
VNYTVVVYREGIGGSGVPEEKEIDRAEDLRWYMLEETLADLRKVHNESRVQLPFSEAELDDPARRREVKAWIEDTTPEAASIRIFDESGDEVNLADILRQHAKDLPK